MKLTYYFIYNLKYLLKNIKSYDWQSYCFPAVNRRPDVNFLKYRTEDTVYSLTYREKLISLDFTGEVVSHDVMSAVRGFPSLPRVTFSKTDLILNKSIFVELKIQTRKMLHEI